MNYGEAKERLLNPHKGENDEDYRLESIAHHVVILSIAENVERIANALTRIADHFEAAGEEEPR